MDICILYGKDSTQHDLFIQAADDYFDTVVAAPVTGTHITCSDDTRLHYKQTDLSTFDAAFIRVFDADLLYGEQIPGILQQHGVYTQMDLDSLSIATNKYYTMNVLAEGGMHVPRSSYLLSTEETERAAEEYGYPVVIKLISGYGGRGVMRASNREDLGPVVDTLTLFEQDICLQQYLDNPGEDIRVIVIGDDTYAYRRVAEDDDEWRSNVSQGAARQPCDPPDAVRDAAVKAARLAGFDICGVDIIQTDDGPAVVELNMSPGVADLDQVLDVDVPQRMMAFMHEQATTRASEKGL